MPEFVRQSISHFSALSREARYLLISFALYSLINPLFEMFSLSYLMRVTGDSSIMPAYMAALSTGIVIGFVLNSYLFSYIDAARSYFSKIILVYLASVIFFIVGDSNPLYILITGWLVGFALGLYWAGRHLLLMRFTKPEERSFFSGIEMSLNIFLSVILPFVYGLWITIGVEHLKLSSKASYLSLYLLIIPVALVVLFFSLKGKFITGLPVKRLKIDYPRQWKNYQLAMLILGMANFGLFISTPLLILTYVGNEFELGSYRSLSSLLASMLLVYLASRRLSENQLIKLFLCFSIAALLVTAVFFAVPGAGTAIAFIISMSLVSPICWNCLNVLGYNLATVLGEAEGIKLSCLASRELYIGYGRLIGFILSSLYFYSSPASFALFIATSQAAAAAVLYLVKVFKD